MMDKGATIEAITWLRDVDKLIRFKGDNIMETELDLIIGVLNGKLKVKWIVGIDFGVGMTNTPQSR